MSGMPHVLEQLRRGEQAPEGLPALRKVADAFAHWARLQPLRPALLDGDQAVSWAQLHGGVQEIGMALGQLGLGPGHRVGLIVPEGLAGAQLVLGVCCSCVLVPINPALTLAELKETVQEAGLDALVVPPSFPSATEIGLLEGLLVLESSTPPAGRAPALRPVPWRLREPPRASEPALAQAMLLLRSSGSTGKPKLVPVTHGNMLAMAGKMGSPEWFGLGPADRSASVLPLFYAAGLKNLLLVPLILGGSVAFPPPGKAFHVGEWLPALKPTFFCTTPTTLRGMLERLEEPASASSLRFIMCGASYLPNELRRAAEAAFRIPVVEYYGLSEAGVMAANPLQPGQARAGSVGRVIGTDLWIADPQGRPCGPGEVGDIVVSGACVCPGYVAPGGSLMAGGGLGVLHTGDIGVLDADHFLQIHGRAKEVINRGGEKVFPYEVERVLLEHEDVLEAAVYGVPHPRLGQSVAAAVVLKPDRATAARDITAWLGGRVAPFKLPRGLRVVPALPRNAAGKVNRSALVQLHQEHPEPRRSAESQLQDELLALWRHRLGVQEVGIDDDFIDLGGDSLLAAELLLDVEKLTGVSSEGWNLASLTVRDMTRAALHTMLQKDTAGGAPSEGPGADLMQQIKTGQGAPLFFCHGDIVSRGIYAHRLAELLPSANPMWVLNSPSRQAGLDVETVATTYLDEVMRLSAAAPGAEVYVAGWCNAGLVAWHLAHLLRERGVRVVSLLLIETPSLNGDGSLRRIAQVLRRAGAVVPGRAGRFLRNEAMRGFWALRRKRMPEFTAAMARRVRGDVYGGSLDTWTPPAMRDNAVLYYQRMSRYVPGPLDVPVTCFVAEQGSRFDTDPSRWHRLSPQVRHVVIPGNHTSAAVSHRPALATHLAEWLHVSATPSIP